MRKYSVGLAVLLGLMLLPALSMVQLRGEDVAEDEAADIDVSTLDEAATDEDSKTEGMAAEVIHAAAKVCQLTSEQDQGVAGTAGLTTGMVHGTGIVAGGITGTDLGWSFEHAGALHFMFGDTRDFDRDKCEPHVCGTYYQPKPVQRPVRTDVRWLDHETYFTWLDVNGNAPESWASAPTTSDPDNCLSLQVQMDGGAFRKTKLNQRILYRQEGGFSGFSDGTDIYGFFNLKSNPPGCNEPEGCAHDDVKRPGGKTVIARSTDGGARFFEQVTFSFTKFQFVAPTEISSGPPGLPSNMVGQPVVFAFGAGREVNEGSAPSQWNQSYPYLAVAPLSEVVRKWGVAYQHSVTSWAGNGCCVSGGTGFPSPSEPIATREDAKWLLSRNHQVYTILTNGDVLAQDVGSVVSPTYQIPRHPSYRYAYTSVATRPEDKWVLMDRARSRILVVTDSGQVWAHDLGTYVGPAYRLPGPAVGARPEDNHVLVVGSRLYVITKRGLVFSHPLLSTTVGEAIRFEGPPEGIAGAIPPASPSERWVFSVDDKIVRVTKTGQIYAHTVRDTAVPPRIDGPVKLTSDTQRLNTAPQDHWLIPVSAPTFGWRFIVIPHYLYSWVFFTGLNVDGSPQWTAPVYTDDTAAKPLPPFETEFFDQYRRHKCFGYYSVRYAPAVAKWIMLYTCDERRDSFENILVDRGVYVRSSSTPWGPWSSPQRIDVASTTATTGYCRYMYHRHPDSTCTPNPFEEEKRHRVNYDGPQQGQPCSGAPEQGCIAVREWGGEYAPFLLPGNYMRPRGAGQMMLYFTLSTWNPYQTILMKAEVSGL